MEYIILLVAIATLLITILVDYGATVEGKWRGVNEDSVWQDIESGLPPDGADDPGCPHYYNSSTGRWHDSGTHLFVPFAEAEAAGC